MRVLGCEVRGGHVLSRVHPLGIPPINPIQAEGTTMKLSARNILKGKIDAVQKGKTTAHVRINIGGAVVTASITNEAVDELKLKKGQTAYAVIKASDVMVAID